MGLTQLLPSAVRRGAVAIALLCAMSHAATAQTRDAKTEAQELFQQGRTAVEAGDCPRAVPLFARSQAVYPARGTLFNLAQCELNVGRLASAQAHFKELLGLLPMADERADVARQRLAELAPRVPKLLVELAPGTPAPSRLLLDQAPLSTTSLGSELGLDPGDHTLAATWADGKPVEFRVSLPEGTSRSLRIAPPAPPPVLPPTATPIVPATPQPGAEPAPAPASTTRRTLALVTGGVGVAIVGASLVTGALAIGTQGDLEAACPDPSKCDDDGLNLASRGETLTTVATVLGAVGLAGLGAGAVLYWTAPKGNTSISLAPTALYGGAGALVRGTF